MITKNVNRRVGSLTERVCSTGEGAQHTNLTQAHSGNLQTGAARSDHFHKVQSARRVVGPGTGLYPACLYVSCHLVLPVAAAPRGLPRWTRLMITLPYLFIYYSYTFFKF